MPAGTGADVDAEGRVSPEDTEAAVSLTERVHAAQVDMLYERNYFAAAMGVPFGAIVCAFGWNDLPRAPLVAWLALKVVTAALRMGLTTLHRRRPGDASPAAWEARYVVGLGIDGLAWTLLGIFFAPPDRAPLAALTLTSLIGIGSVGGVVLSTHLRANVVFMSALLLPAALWQLAIAGRAGLFVFIGFVAFFVLVIDQGRRSSRATEELLRLRFEIARARDAALAGTRAKSAFLATMSHELRTPLNAVLGMATLLGDADLPARHRDKVEAIRVSGEALLALIGDILDLSKAEAGKVELERVPADVARCVEDSLDQVLSAASSKGLGLAYELSIGCPDTVVTDPTRLKQILVNLLSNATKFTESGSVMVSAESTPLPGGRAELSFSVSDTGAGIAAGAIETLFRPFSQVDASTTRRFGGTGLGLAICKQLSELLGGGIRVDSRLGEGSTFRFTIVAEVPPQKESSRLAGRALVVCDRPVEARCTAAHLARLGLEVAVVEAEMDVALPSSDPAWELAVVDVTDEARVEALTQSLRRARPELPIAVYVASGSGYAPGVAGIAVLYRPFRVRRLLEGLDVLAGKRPPAPGPVAARPTVPPQDISVLVVDDNTINRTVSIEMVRSLGYRATAVDSGRAALARAGAEPVDIVLMDVQMPEMDGFETTRRLRGAKGTDGPYVIGLTANAMPGDREQCLAAGMTDYLTKPLRLNLLAQALERARGTASERVSARAAASEVVDAGALDMDVVQELLILGDRALLEELLETFRADSVSRLAELRAAVAASDGAALRRAAHALRGVAATMGATRVRAAAGRLEQIAAGQATGEPGALVDEIALELPIAHRALEQHIAGSVAS